MRLYFEIIARVEGLPLLGGNKMNDWARSEAGKLKKSLAEKSSNEAAFQERQRLKRELGRDKWEEVRKQFTAQCQAVNEEMGQEIFFIDPVGSPYGFHLVAKVQSAIGHINVKFKPETGPLSWAYQKGNPEGSYELDVMPDGSVQFCERAGTHNAVSPESIAQKLISLLSVIFIKD